MNFFLTLFTIQKSSRLSLSGFLFGLVFISGIMVSDVNKVQAQSCLPEGYNFYSQQDVDYFLANYSDCTEILGNVIVGSPFFDLDFFSQITAVHGFLAINSADFLFDLSGLENLNHVGHQLIIKNMDLIENLDQLNGLRSVGGLEILSNKKLKSLSGLHNLDSITNSVFILGNNNLISLNGFEKIERINSNLSINSNDSLRDISSLNRLRRIDGNFNFSENDAIRSFSSLNELTYIGGDFLCESNDSLQNFDGLNALENVGGDLIIQFNDGLTNFNGMESLNAVTRDVSVFFNKSLVNLEGLSKLQFIGNALHIEGNKQLINLNGLDAMTGFGLEFIYIYSNDSLTSIAGLKNMDFSLISRASFINNTSLNDCAIQSICQHLAICGSNLNFSNNAPFCNSYFEIESNCEAKPDINYYPLCNIEVFPNPSDQFLNIIIKERDAFGVEYEIFDQLGQRVAFFSDWGAEVVEQIDISSFPRGAYFLKLSSWKFSEVIRFVKE